jgi:hypothetical protein
MPQPGILGFALADGILCTLWGIKGINSLLSAFSSLVGLLKKLETRSANFLHILLLAIALRS